MLYPIRFGSHAWLSFRRPSTRPEFSPPREGAWHGDLEYAAARPDQLSHRVRPATSRFPPSTLGGGYRHHLWMGTPIPYEPRWSPGGTVRLHDRHDWRIPVHEHLGH